MTIVKNIGTSRRQLITGLISFIAAPAIVRASSLMPVKAFVLPDHRLCVGDIITFDGIHAFNRYTKQKTDVLKAFVVTAAIEDNELSIYPYEHFGGKVILNEDLKIRLRKHDDFDYMDVYKI